MAHGALQTPAGPDPLVAPEEGNVVMRVCDNNMKIIMRLIIIHVINERENNKRKIFSNVVL